MVAARRAGRDPRRHRIDFALAVDRLDGPAPGDRRLGWWVHGGRRDRQPAGLDPALRAEWLAPTEALPTVQV